MTQTRERRPSAQRQVAFAERTARQGVTNADVTIEVRKWHHASWIGLVALDHDGQPEAKFAEPNGRWIDVDAEDRPREDVAPDLAHRSFVAEPRANRGQP